MKRNIDITRMAACMIVYLEKTKVITFYEIDGYLHVDITPIAICLFFGMLVTFISIVTQDIHYDK